MFLFVCVDSCAILCALSEQHLICMRLIPFDVSCSSLDFFLKFLSCVAGTDNLDIGALADPTMIGVLVGLGLMFIIMCVVLRLFSK